MRILVSTLVLSVAEVDSGMADYQHLPDIKDTVTKLRMAMSDMDGKTF